MSTMRCSSIGGRWSMIVKWELKCTCNEYAADGHSGLPEPYASEHARLWLHWPQHPFMCHQLPYMVKKRSTSNTWRYMYFALIPIAIPCLGWSFPYISPSHVGVSNIFFCLVHFIPLQHKSLQHGMFVTLHSHATINMLKYLIAVSIYKYKIKHSSKYL